MRKYEIKITQTLYFYKTVEAENEEELKEIVFDMDLNELESAEITTDYMVLDIIGD